MGVSRINDDQMTVNGTSVQVTQKLGHNLLTVQLARVAARGDWSVRAYYSLGLLNWEDRCGVGAETCEQVKRNKETSRVTLAIGSTMVLDSSGSGDGERRRLWEMRSATVARVRDRDPMEIAESRSA
jgi:hypothetical protein